jgi:hypothetical protein
MESSTGMTSNKTCVGERGKHRLRGVRQKDVIKLLYSRAESAHSLGLSKRSIDYLIAMRKLATRRIGSRVLIPFSELRRFAAGNHPEALAEVRLN